MYKTNDPAQRDGRIASDREDAGRGVAEAGFGLVAARSADTGYQSDQTRVTLAAPFRCTNRTRV